MLPLAQAYTWFQTNLAARLLAGLLFMFLLAWLFYRAGRGTGWSLYVLLATGFSALFAVSPLLHVLAFLPLLILLGAIERRRIRSSRPYRPAVATVESGGIKRGLTAPEAGVLLEVPVNLVIASALAGLLKKGLLEEVQTEPWVLAVAMPYRVHQTHPDPRERAVHLRLAAQRTGALLHPYEEPFLALLEEGAGRPFAEQGLSVPLKSLLRGVSVRVGGHHMDETRSYYRLLLQRARRDSEASGEADGWSVIDHHLEWLILDAGAWSYFGKIWMGYRPPWRRAASGGEAETFDNWIERALAACDTAFGERGLRARGPGGTWLTLGGSDPISAAFLEAVAAGG